MGKQEKEAKREKREEEREKREEEREKREEKRKKGRKEEEMRERGREKEKGESGAKGALPSADAFPSTKLGNNITPMKGRLGKNTTPTTRETRANVSNSISIKDARLPEGIRRRRITHKCSS